MKLTLKCRSKNEIISAFKQKIDLFCANVMPDNVGNLPKNCLRVFDHFVELDLTGYRHSLQLNSWMFSFYNETKININFIFHMTGLWKKKSRKCTIYVTKNRCLIHTSTQRFIFLSRLASEFWTGPRLKGVMTFPCHDDKDNHD